MPKEMSESEALESAQKFSERYVERGPYEFFPEKEIVEEVNWVPGSMEVPLQIKRLFLRESIDGAVVLGIIENGETKHGLVMGQAVIDSLLNLQLASMKPIGFGIIGPGAKPEHIDDRLLPYAENAMLALSEMLSNSI